MIMQVGWKMTSPGGSATTLNPYPGAAMTTHLLAQEGGSIMVANPNPARKAISKRLRYEILRRDNHACRYCGATAPDVKLTVDHVVPTTLGGTDEASNLITACADCNAGKSSSSPGADLVADVREDALRHAQMLQEAYAVLVERIGFREYYEAAFEDNYGYGLPDGWENSVGRWFEMGVPVELIIDAAQKATRVSRPFRGTERFRYFCGIVWNQVAAVDAITADKAALEGAFYTEGRLTDTRYESWKGGWSAGYECGAQIESEPTDA